MRLSPAPSAPPARWDSVIFRRPDPDVTGRACLLWTILVLALALLLGAACSDSKGGGADAAMDRPADTNLDMGMAEGLAATR